MDSEAVPPATAAQAAAGAGCEGEPGSNSLTVVYDHSCELCRRCRNWLMEQPTRVPVTFIASESVEAMTRWGSVAGYGTDLMVVDASGYMWQGTEAFVMCLWSTHRYEWLAHRLGSGTFESLAERFFHALSSKRSTVSGLLRPSTCTDATCHLPAAPGQLRSNVHWSQ